MVQSSLWSHALVYRLDSLDAETGVVFSGSGLGDAKTTKEVAGITSDAAMDPVKFNQSTISIATKKALDIACARILDRMIKKGIFVK